MAEIFCWWKSSFNLASQGYRLIGLLALHRNNPRARDASWQQAVHLMASPARIRYEIINHQTRVALTLNDQETFCTLLEEGVKGTRVLRSDQRRQEALRLYKDARVVWSDEARIRSLSDLFLSGRNLGWQSNQ